MYKLINNTYNDTFMIATDYNDYNYVVIDLLTSPMNIEKPLILYKFLMCFTVIYEDDDLENVRERAMLEIL